MPDSRTTPPLVAETIHLDQDQILDVLASHGQSVHGPGVYWVRVIIKPNVDNTVEVSAEIHKTSEKGKPS